MKIGKVRPEPVKAPQRVERKVKIKKEQPVPVKLPEKKEQDVPA